MSERGQGVLMSEASWIAYHAFACGPGVPWECAMRGTLWELFQPGRPDPDKPVEQ